MSLPNFFLDISSSWVLISLHAKFQLPRLPGRRTTSFRLNPILGVRGRGGGLVAYIFSLIFLLVGLK